MLTGVKHIILVLSGKGGVGKSTVSVQLALALKEAGYKVGLLDVDLCGPSIPYLLQMENQDVHQCPEGWVPVYADNDQRLAVMSIGFLLKDRKDAVVWRGPKKTDKKSSTSRWQLADTNVMDSETHRLKLFDITLGKVTDRKLADTDSHRQEGHRYIEQISKTHRHAEMMAYNPMIRQFLTDVHWQEIDYLIIDTPPGTSDEHITVMENLRELPCDGALLVTTPQAVAVEDVRKELTFCRKTGIPVLGILENMSGYVCPNCSECSNIFSSGGGKALAEISALPFLGTLPIDPRVGKLSTSRTSCVTALPGSPAAAVFKSIVDTIVKK